MNYGIRLATSFFVSTLLVVVAPAQSASPASKGSSKSPEDGFVSISRYTNAFFGFSLPLPHDSALREYTLPSKEDARHFLFGLQSQKVGSGFLGMNIKLTAFTVTADGSKSGTPEDAREAASHLKGSSPARIEIGGRGFWRSESQQKGAGGKMRTVAYATALNGYILQFNVASFDQKLTDQLQHGIEAMTFFEPAKAEEVAGPGSRPYNPLLLASARENSDSSNSRIGQLNPGVVSGNTYTNDALEFAYQFPEGWVVNDKATQDKVMEAGHQFVWGSGASAAREHEEFKRCARVLLFATKYPAGTKAKDINPVIVLMAADPKCFGGTSFPGSIDDRDSIREVARQLAHTFAGTPFAEKGKNSVSAFTNQGHLMIEFSTSLSNPSPGKGSPSNIFTALDLTQSKDFWLLWGFMSGSEAGLEELKNTQIAFRSPASASAATQ